MLIWKIEFDTKAQSELLKLDKQTQKRIVDYLEKRVLGSEDPKSLGQPLKGGLSGLWRYRIGDYRLICKIEQETLTIVALSVGHRKHIYKISGVL